MEEHTNMIGIRVIILERIEIVYLRDRSSEQIWMIGTRKYISLLIYLILVY